MPSKIEVRLCQRHIAVDPSHQMLRSAAMLMLILRRCALLCMLPSKLNLSLGNRAIDIPCIVLHHQSLLWGSACLYRYVAGAQVKMKPMQRTERSS